MKILRFFQHFDLVVQAFCVTGASLPLLLYAVDPGFLIWSLVFLFFLGAWQLISALALGFWDKFRHLYFLTAIAYCGLFFTGAFFYNRFEEVWDLTRWLDVDVTKYCYLAFLALSYVAGLFYFTYSYRYCRAGKNDTSNDLSS